MSYHLHNLLYRFPSLFFSTNCSPSFPSLPLWPDSAADPPAAAALRLESCTDPSELSQIHAFVVRHRLVLVPFHWNSLMRCYLRLSRPTATLRLFIEMTRAGAMPDFYSLPIALKAAAISFSFFVGRQLHPIAVKLCLARHEFSESGLISLYAKSSEFSLARQLFDENPSRKLGSWNALISSYSQCGHSARAIDLFLELRRSGEVGDNMTMASVASACGSSGDIRFAQQVHKCALQTQTSNCLDITLSNSLIDMYAKCGRTDLAGDVFDEMPKRNVSSWTAMIMGLASQGSARRAVELFRQMERDGVEPNHVTMVAVLCACAHGGMVEEGMMYFDAIVEGRIRGVEATAAHYGCVVDMLGKVGRVAEAAAMAERMPAPAGAVVWGTLLGACEKHGEVGIGERAAAKLMELEPWNDGVYVVLSNIYAGEGMWREVERVRRLMRQCRVEKTPGFSLPAVSARAS
ncbi:Pentatricopeptide repeat-containing protein [Apostasia shenzhenica]|uniref:Pentatricopeptide repeat-containing protein n=1 Tax=Apostasia shenzhenica TaxID=1088818 RepID=A0A2I0BC14_9ASPA|nr:Pentatricopeptide repeat-containing protein [Apostasia shenzhenica]